MPINRPDTIGVMLPLRPWTIAAQSGLLGAVSFGIGWMYHREEYAAVAIVAGMMLARWFLPLIWPQRWQLVRLTLDVTALAAGFVLGFWLARGDWWYIHSVVEMAALGWINSMTIGMASALLLNRWRLPARLKGPYCRRCGYCLIGTAEHRCPECGRAFTLRELGVSEAELRAS